MAKLIKPNSPLAWAICLGILLAFLLGIAFIIFLSFAGILNYETRFFLAVLWFTVASLVAFIRPDEGGLRRVPLGHRGVLMIGDKIMLILGPGPAFIVPPIIELSFDSMRIIKGEFTLENVETANPKKVDYEKLGVKKEEFSDSYLDRQIAVSAKFEFFYYIEGMSYADYKENVGSNDKFMEIIPDMAVGIASEEFSLRTPAIINSHKREISKIVQDELQKAIDFKENPNQSWRVKIQKVQMWKIILPASIVSMMEEQVLADMRKYVTLIDAQAKGEAFNITEVFKYKAEEVGARLITAARLVGKAEGYDALAKALKMDKPALLAKLETIENTFKNTEKMWFSGQPGMSGLLSFLPALGEALKGSDLGKDK
jgi:regulator of protease activity HflC (stomatin/prohibitin superfamily)